MRNAPPGSARSDSHRRSNQWTLLRGREASHLVEVVGDTRGGTPQRAGVTTGDGDELRPVFGA